MKYFHQYLYGRRFTLITDHKPLMTILGPKTGVPLLAAVRLVVCILLYMISSTSQRKSTAMQMGSPACPCHRQRGVMLELELMCLTLHRLIVSLKLRPDLVRPHDEIEYSERSGATRSPVGLRIAQITYNHTGRGGTSSLSKVFTFCGESEQLYHCHYRREYSKNCIRSIKELLR